ncbi:glycoside hydrolase family 128 protein [Karstenula rhodostoma CBS 690.94]|uniref:Glycoside hydrolase family 128 protein n=1 Tax=Karstenula rhodostoma CBS 690.94 TaxID=1392251 RepID=A0A9P4PMY0_9PLEO|nr:glycoside hydrolase family 128 protein [Karstenula rhodostoma CBS 690.94]
MAFFRCAAAAALLTLVTASSSSKRGLCVIPPRDNPHHAKDSAIWTTGPGSHLTWYYNYGTTPTGEYKNTPGFEFVPMFWGAPEGGFTGDTPFLDSIREQIKDGSNITHVLGFNEPDGSFEYGASNIPAQVAAEEWKRQMEPLKEHGVKLGAPAVTGTPAGATWLQDFFSHCNGSCNPDFLPVHFYGTFEALANRVTEWGYNHQDLLTTQHAFNESIRMLDDWSKITRYSYFGAFRSDTSNVGPNSAMLTEEGKLTDIGSWYLDGPATNNIPHNSWAGVLRASNGVIKVAVILILVGYFVV